MKNITILNGTLMSQSRQGSSGDDGYSAGAVAQGEFKQVQEYNKGSGGGKEGTEGDTRNSLIVYLVVNNIDKNKY